MSGTQNLFLLLLLSLYIMLLSSFAPRTLQKTSNNFSKTRLHSHTCAIIGGGPSGYYAAISLAERLTLEGKKGKITIYEGMGKTLQKVRISGKATAEVTA